ncbi:VanZ family protein [Pseudoxanthomonas sp. NC8]|nr:VanZ family protein [Pseudoxanthomonas sp. NC8]
MALALALVVVAVAVLLPNWRLAALRVEFPWFSQSISRTEQLWPAVDMVHVVMFAIVGLLAALAFPAARLGRLLLVVFVLAMATEFIQIWVPGRTSSLVEVLLDVVAALLGMMPVFACRSLASLASQGARGQIALMRVGSQAPGEATWSQGLRCTGSYRQYRSGVRRSPRRARLPGNLIGKRVA